MTRISKPPQERKKEILETAMEMFLKNGYENTSVSDIVHKLNVAQGLFYYYFKSKEEVFRAALEQYTDEFTEKLIAIIRDGSMSFIRRLELVLRTMRNMFAESTNALTMEMQRAELIDLDYRLSIHITQSLIEPVSVVLDELNERGVAHIKDTVSTASFLVFGIYGLIHSGDERMHNSDNLEPEIVVGLISGVLGIKPEILMNL